MPTMPLLTLDEIRGDAGQVSLAGVIHRVTPMDGAAFRDLRIIGKKHKAGQSTPDDIDTMYAIAGRCIPSLSSEEIYRLTVPQLNGIIAMAANQIEMVEEMVRAVLEKNGRAPAAAMGTAPNGASAPASPAESQAQSNGASSPVELPGSASSIPSAS